MRSLAVLLSLGVIFSGSVRSEYRGLRGQLDRRLSCLRGQLPGVARDLAHGRPERATQRVQRCR